MENEKDFENTEILPEQTENVSEDMVMEPVESEEVLDSDAINADDDLTIVEEEPVKKPIEKIEKTAKTVKRRKKKTKGAPVAIILATVILSVSALIAFFVITVGRDVLGVNKSEEVYTIDIKEGMTTAEISEYLKEEDFIEYPKFFQLMCKLNGGSLYPGPLEISPSMSYSEMIVNLMEIRAEKPTVTVVFPEGITLLEAANLLEANEVCSAEDFLFAFNNESYGEKYKTSDSKLKFYQMEGFLFPNKYNFYIGDTPQNVIKSIRNSFKENVNDGVLGRMALLDYDLNELLTLASIVQSEAASEEDMKKIASVFINRLNNKAEYPKLQSDPTTAYVRDVIKPNIKIAYPDMFNAYDTYIGIGLPPGPICNPGMMAINAVLYPVDTPYYFFCADIKTKEVFYATTNEEHEKNLVKANLA